MELLRWTARWQSRRARSPRGRGLAVRWVRSSGMRVTGKFRRSPQRSSAIFAVWYVIAWLPLIAAYWLALRATSAGITPGIALLAALSSVSVPMIGGAVTWRLAARLPSPERRPIAFASTHIVAGTLFVMVWMWSQALQLRVGTRAGA